MDIEDVALSDAIEYAVECAFETEDGRELIHCWRGSFGADWELSNVLYHLRKTATRIAWIDTIYGVCLATESEEGIAIFDGIRRDQALKVMAKEPDASS